MKHSLVGMLALVGALAACSGSTSPEGTDLTAPGTGTGPQVTPRFVDATGLRGDLYVNSVLKTHAEVFDSGYPSYLQASSVPRTVVVKWAEDPRLVLASTQTTFAVASNVAYETSSPYVSSPAGPTRIIVTYAASDYVLFDSGTRPFSAGEAWTMLLMYPGGELTSVIGMWIKDRG